MKISGENKVDQGDSWGHGGGRGRGRRGGSFGKKFGCSGKRGPGKVEEDALVGGKESESGRRQRGRRGM